MGVIDRSDVIDQVFEDVFPTLLSSRQKTLNSHAIVIARSLQWGAGCGPPQGHVDGNRTCNLLTEKLGLIFWAWNHPCMLHVDRLNLFIRLSDGFHQFLKRFSWRVKGLGRLAWRSSATRWTSSGFVLSRRRWSEVSLSRVPSNQPHLSRSPAGCMCGETATPTGRKVKWRTPGKVLLFKLLISNLDLFYLCLIWGHRFYVKQPGGI